jgi:hypothetical protein
MHHRAISGASSAMAAHEAAASMSGFVDMAKWGMAKGDTDEDEDEDDILCSCGKVGALGPLRVLHVSMIFAGRVHVE